MTTNQSDRDQLQLPLLGTATDLGTEEITLAHEFGELHNLIYTKGGIRPTNAAIEEVAKLISLRLWSGKRGTGAGAVDAAAIFAEKASASRLVAETKTAFAEMLKDPEMSTRDTFGELRPLWPLDEPFRLDNAEVLKHAIALVGDIVDSHITVSDPLGAAFDAFLSGRYDHAGGLGTYLTPSSIARMMSDVALELLEVDPAERAISVIDPFCGTGRFLVSAYEALARAGASKKHLENFVNSHLVGADQSPQAVAKSGLNLMLLGATNPRVFAVPDSITAPELRDTPGQYDLVLTNPPFGGGKYDNLGGIAFTARLFGKLRGKSIDPALAGAALALNLVRPGGIVGIVLPDGVINSQPFMTLARSGDFEACAIVSLPTVTFSLSGTVAKTSAVFLRKRSKGPGRTALARVEHVGFKKQAGKAVADPDGNEIDAIPALLREAFAEDAQFEDIHVLSEVPLVTSVRSDLIESLDPARLDPEATAHRSRLIDNGGARAHTIITDGRTRRSARKANEPFVSVLHVDALGNIDWASAMSYQPTTGGQIAESGQILVSLLNPSKFRAAVVPPHIERVQCSLEFGVFTPSIDPYVALGLLYREDVRSQLRPLGSGTSSSRRRISELDVLNLVIPNLSALALESLGGDVQQAMDSIERSRAILERSYSGLSASDS